MTKSEQENSKSDPVIVWFRDDLRISDNPALIQALKSGQPVLAVYILEDDDEEIRTPGAAQKWFLHHALASLRSNLNKAGCELYFFKGSSCDIIRELVSKNDICKVVWNRRYGGREVGVDTSLKTELGENGVGVESFLGNLLHEPYATKTTSDGPYKVYSPFWRALESKGEPRQPHSVPEQINGAKTPEGPTPVTLGDLKLLPTNPNWAEGWEVIWNPGETGASEALEDFIDEGLAGYKGGRDFPARSHCSRLSPFLRFGCISPYQIWHAIRSAETSSNLNASDCEKFLKELAWREFSYHLLFHFPDIGWKNIQDKFDAFPWRSDGGDDLERWKRGQTGYPIVDAGMRELWQTGYMHNRIRMVVGSFLVKHLLIHWHQGERWFWDTLVDGDPANNTASWQWIAGSGADAAPYFRVFNPMLQGEKFDPDGTYVRRYVPEIADLPDKHIHAPFDAPAEILEKCGIKLGETYPHPIVDHKAARNRALSAFDEIKKADA